MRILSTLALNFNNILQGLLLVAIAIAPFETKGQAPYGYYDSTIGKYGYELKVSLHDIIKGHIRFPYSSSEIDVWDILKESDRDPTDSTKVIGIYSGFKMNAAKEYNKGQGWNREHVWAKSRGNFGTSLGPGTDLHHIRVADISTNSARNNRDFGECTEEYIDESGVYRGITYSYTSSTEWVWEPRDAVKGDIARMLFYMSVRYEGRNGEIDLELTELQQPAGSKEPFHGKLSVLIKWHLEDPVDDYERRRNEVIFKYQRNRNPFIDHPEFVLKIWLPYEVKNSDQ